MRASDFPSNLLSGEMMNFKVGSKYKTRGGTVKKCVHISKNRTYCVLFSDDDANVVWHTKDGLLWSGCEYADDIISDVPVDEPAPLNLAAGEWELESGEVVAITELHDGSHAAIRAVYPFFFHDKNGNFFYVKHDGTAVKARDASTQKLTRPHAKPTTLEQLRKEYDRLGKSIPTVEGIEAFKGIGKLIAELEAKQS